MSTNPRTAGQARKTTETDVNLRLNLDGTGASTIETGIPFFDHMLTLFSRHSLIDLEIRVDGDVQVDFHHTVEDTGIVLGECIREALGDKRGITRYGHAFVPMDEALSRVVVDLSNRPWLEFHASEDTPSAQNFPFSLVEEFCRALCSNLRANLHVEVFYGRDGHHIAESVFKALARAIRVAVTPDARVIGVPSTKELL
ncbi:MAG: imidazoleglycerol-phosphate dehydratase HisB [Verrucomicrobia bacterium]|nr:imidazoleglycerol-phosphate dehydratase HisB [Verrucomicrobiota bacterium]MDA1004971.1 imidazoleglycerol-phosphate dehydratase HisB [Verrucomicrobiota bacterium]